MHDFQGKDFWSIINTKHLKIHFEPASQKNVNDSKMNQIHACAEQIEKNWPLGGQWIHESAYNMIETNPACQMSGTCLLVTPTLGLLELVESALQ